MKHAFRNTVSLDKFRGRLTNRSITSLLILSALGAALFPTPTTAFARSNVSAGDLWPAGSMISIPNGGIILNPLHTLLSLHMLNKTDGWATAEGSILKTADGGLHWQNVTPANVNLNHAIFETDFLNDQDAWVTPLQQEQKSMSVLRTTNGGKSWQSSTIQTTGALSSATPHFLNASDGWLVAFGDPGGEGQPLLIFRTTDGGQHWKQLGSPNQQDIPHPRGITFNDTQNGWVTAYGGAGTQPPLLGVTHDGSKTWHSQSLVVIPEGSKSDLVRTLSPLFFGNNGLLPVEYPMGSLAGGKSSPSIGLDLYVTHNAGQSWTPTTFLTTTITSNLSSSLTVLDMQHAWAAFNSNLSVTSNGGQSWTSLPPTPQPIDGLSFVDANTGWALGSLNRITKKPQSNLLHTTDGGRTWQRIDFSIVSKSTPASPIGGGSTSTTPVGTSKHDCGTLSYQQKTDGNGLLLQSWTNASAQQNVNCFLQAIQQCVPASIHFNISQGGGVFLDNIYDTTKPQSGNCTITHTINDLQGDTTSTQCARVEQTGTNVSFSCNGFNFVYPLK